MNHRGANAPQNVSQSLIDYSISANLASKVVTQTFSSSFGSAITLFDPEIRQDIYNIYGLVRVADEIVDTYQGSNAKQLLDSFENEVYEGLQRNFSANIIIHSFIGTAKQYDIGKELIEPFFTSMRMDLKPQSYTQTTYETYIYGSAEVVGLMCLKVFVQGNETQYKNLKKGAQSLGAGFQKVNFLRDIRDDFMLRKRYYFPNGSFDAFDESLKKAIVSDIKRDFTSAQKYIDALPSSSRQATRVAYKYYELLLLELSACSASEIKAQRVSVSKRKKLLLLTKAKLASYAP